MKIKSVQSANPCQSVIQTFYDIVKVHGGEWKVAANEQNDAVLIIHLSIHS